MKLLSMIRSATKITLRSSNYVAVSMSSSALFGLVASIPDKPIYEWMVLGFFLPVAPTLLYFTSDRMMKHRLQSILQWKSENLISKDQYEKLQANIIEWYSQRVTGISTRTNENESESESDP